LLEATSLAAPPAGSIQLVRFEVLTVEMSMVVFWVVMLCGLVDGYQRFGGNILPPFSGMKTTKDSIQLVLFQKEDRFMSSLLLSHCIGNKIILMFQSNKLMILHINHNSECGLST
jgi:hypothetical protein